MFRRYKLDAEIAAMTWKVHWDDIVWFPNTKLRSSFHSTGSLPRRGSMTVSQNTHIEQMESPILSLCIATLIACILFVGVYLMEYQIQKGIGLTK